MEQNIKKIDSLYVEEWQSRENLLKTEDVRFFYYKFEKGSKDASNPEIKTNYLVIILDGQIRISCDLYEDREISSGEMFVIPKSTQVYGECLKDTRLLTLAFRIPATSCGKLNFKYLTELTKSIDYNFDTIEIKPPVGLFCDLMVMYLTQNCEYLHETKYNEIFICLSHYYSDQELAILFYPILSDSFDFQRFIMENYRDVKFVHELVELSGMGKSAFYEKFHQVFGISAKRWLANKTNSKLIDWAAQPGMTVKRLMAEFKFGTLSQFQAYCKHNFRLTPTMLIKKAITGNIASKIDDQTQILLNNNQKWVE